MFIKKTKFNNIHKKIISILYMIYSDIGFIVLEFILKLDFIFIKTLLLNNNEKRLF